MAEVAVVETKVKAPTITEEQPRLRMSYEEFLAWADEDVHAEWVDGEVIVQMPPKTVHQAVAFFIAKILGLFADFLNLGYVFTAPFEMRLSPDGPSREPDVLFVSREHLDRLTEDRLEGPADLVVEVVSDESVVRDRVDKFYEYQDFGVREYWLIDPRPDKQRADFWVLDEQGRYQPVPIDSEGLYRSTVVPGFWLKVDWLWQDPLPDPWDVLVQVIGREKLIERLGAAQ
ncbi:MAG TPA: Uma2 family endonuclease [Firmicutes bacterium]|nr:Uma2 family endonuclease [Bacillota bacterium]